jgi:ribosomal protein S18 acetylase RimI-like enzyme
MEIIAAVLSDIPSICEILNLAYRGEEAKKGWTYESDLIEGDKRTSEEDLSTLLSKKNTLFFVAKNQNQKVIGTLLLEIKDKSLHMGMLSVQPSLQGNGLGKMLFSKAVETGKLLHLKNILIQVVHVRTELIAWYEKLGFIPTGNISPFEVPLEFGKPRVPIHFMEMSYSISQNHPR